MAPLKTIEWTEGKIRIVDQTQLPLYLTFTFINTAEEMFWAIKTLKVRGAPAIGVAAAFGLYLGIRNVPDSSSFDFFTECLQKTAGYIASSRPTAINLKWALDRMQSLVRSTKTTSSIEQIKTMLLEEAKRILAEDNHICRAIGEHGFAVLKEHTTLLTHCNAGGLATVEYGTALAPVYIGKEKGKIFHLYVDETRPLLQGSRITAFELKEAGIPLTLICDSMAATVIAQGKIDAVIVGADRIAANGDVANKIGTYSVALAAKAHAIPFYVAAPLSTFDITVKNGKEIPIEERPAEEITKAFGRQTAPSDISVYNPSFDITPHELITAIITEKRVIYPPYEKTISEVTAAGLLI